MEKPIYKSWIRVGKIKFFSLIILVLLVSTLLIDNLIIDIILLLSIIICGYILLIISCSYYYFTKKGYQQKIHNTIVNMVNPKININLLDIGAGSGSLSIAVSKTLETSNITAIDYWGDDWEYSKQLCENNARIEKQKDISFIKASASRLPFETEYFDTVISCLTFHEVKDEENIYNVLAEAQRTLKNTGQFIYLDLFLDSKIYQDIDMNLKSIGLKGYKLIKLNDVIELPWILKHKKVLGNAAILTGYKDKD